MPLEPVQNITGKKLLAQFSLTENYTFGDTQVGEFDAIKLVQEFLDANMIAISAGFLAFLKPCQIQIVIKNGVFTNADVVNDISLYFGIGTTGEYAISNPTVLTKNTAAGTFDLDETIKVKNGNRLLIKSSDIDLSILQKTITNQFTYIEIYEIADAN